MKIEFLGSAPIKQCTTCGHVLARDDQHTRCWYCRRGRTRNLSCVKCGAVTRGQELCSACKSAAHRPDSDPAMARLQDAWLLEEWHAASAAMVRREQPVRWWR